MDADLRNAIAAVVKSGRTPSVANLKIQLDKRIPLPVLIQAVQTWQAKPEAFESVEEPVAAATVAEAQPPADASVEQRLARIEASLEELKGLIRSLTR